MSIEIRNCGTCNEWGKNKKCRSEHTLYYRPSENDTCKWWQPKVDIPETTTSDNYKEVKYIIEEGRVYKVDKDGNATQHLLGDILTEANRLFLRHREQIINLEKQNRELTERIEKLEKYGKSVYEAIQMFSEDYISKGNGTTALYNGILSLLDKYDFVSKAISQPLKQEKWIVHRTLRTKGVETYVSYKYIDEPCKTFLLKIDNKILWTYKEQCMAQRFSKEEAIKTRDELNKYRVGKQYLWVISKVEE